MSPLKNIAIVCFRPEMALERPRKGYRLASFCVAQLNEPPEKGLDPKVLQAGRWKCLLMCLQVNMTGFMERKVGVSSLSLEISGLKRLENGTQAGTFVAELWQHLLSAQVGRCFFSL